MLDNIDWFWAAQTVLNKLWKQRLKICTHCEVKFCFSYHYCKVKQYEVRVLEFVRMRPIVRLNIVMHRFERRFFIVLN